MNTLNLRLVNSSRFLSKHFNKLGSLQKGFSNTSTWIQTVKSLDHDILPDIINNVMVSPKISNMPEVAVWIQKILEHNISGGKHLGSTMLAYEMLEKPEYVTQELLKQSKIIRGCAEMAYGAVCIADDMMDRSTTRGSVPCWYRMPNVGMGAVNDVVLLSKCISETIKTHFLHTPYFAKLLRLFNEAELYSTMGQYMDFAMAHHTKKNDYSLFTIDRYNAIVKHKTTYNIIRLPVVAGLTLVRDIEDKTLANVDDICFKIGELYQMQDDYLDCYLDEVFIGKAGTDIQERKCTWLAVTALQHCNENQRKLFTKYYGNEDSESVDRIKNLYEELRLSELYKVKEKEIHKEIISRISTLPSERMSTFFCKVLDQIYKRSR